MQLAYFPPLNYTCYPAVSKQYIVPRDNPWIPSDGAFSLMKEMAEQVGDRKIEKWIHFMKGIHILLLQGVLQFYYIGMRMQK